MARLREKMNKEATKSLFLPTSRLFVFFCCFVFWSSKYEKGFHCVWEWWKRKHMRVRPPSCCINCAHRVPTPTAVLMHNLPENKKNGLQCAIWFDHKKHQHKTPINTGQGPVIIFVRNTGIWRFPPNRFIIIQGVRGQSCPLARLCVQQILAYDFKLAPPMQCVSADGLHPYGTSAHYQPTPILNPWSFHYSRCGLRKLQKTIQLLQELSQWPFHSWMAEIHLLDIAKQLCVLILGWNTCWCLCDLISKSTKLGIWGCSHCLVKPRFSTLGDFHYHIPDTCDIINNLTCWLGSIFHDTIRFILDNLEQFTHTRLTWHCSDVEF